MSKGGLDAVKLGGGWRVLVTVVKGKELFRMFVSIHESIIVINVTLAPLQKRNSIAEEEEISLSVRSPDGPSHCLWQGCIIHNTY